MEGPEELLPDKAELMLRSPAVQPAKLGRKKLAEQSFVRFLNYHGITGWDRQTIFAPPRRWQADFCWIRERLIVEIEGITYFGGKDKLGRHQTATGFVKDAEKYEAAMMLGYVVYRVPHTWIIKDKREIWRPEVANNIKKLLEERS